LISVRSEVQVLPGPPAFQMPDDGLHAERVHLLSASGGAVAQLGERLLCKQEVTGSIPVSSTNAGGRTGWRQGADRQGSENESNSKRGLERRAFACNIDPFFSRSWTSWIGDVAGRGRGLSGRRARRVRASYMPAAGKEEVLSKAEAESSSSQGFVSARDVSCFGSSASKGIWWMPWH
jgi:hypothetical protein